MKLSDILSEKDEIIRDGIFSSMGTLFSHYPQQIVYALRENDITKIAGNSSVTCVITTSTLVSRIPETMGIVSSRDPRYTFYTLQSEIHHHPEFNLQPFNNRISPSAQIHPSAIISPTSVEIGRNVVIEKNVIINEQTIIDEGSIIRSNSTIGNTPLLPGPAVHYQIICPSGGVHLHRDVDIHANTCIYKAIFKGYTEIGEQTKIDNLNTVGSGTTIGKRCLFCGGVTVGESTAIGDNTWIGPNATLGNQIQVGNNVYITIGSTVTHDISDDKVVKDNFAIDRKRFRKVIRGM